MTIEAALVQLRREMQWVKWTMGTNLAVTTALLIRLLFVN